MANHVAHFAIQADDVDRAVSFYETVFGWTAKAWGPPGFFQIDPAQSGVRGAIQKRRVFEGAPTQGPGFECTIGVDDVDAIAEKVRAAGGKVVMDKAVIAGVGSLMFFADSEGNVFGAMQYEAPP